MENSNEISELNLIGNLVNPLLKRNYVFPDQQTSNNYTCEDIGSCIKIYIKILFIILSLIGISLISYYYFRKDPIAITFFIILYIIISTITLVAHFPIFFRNSKTTGNCLDVCKILYFNVLSITFNYYLEKMCWVFIYEGYLRKIKYAVI